MTQPFRERDVADAPRANDTYARLATAFDKHHRDPRGMEYLTGNQVVSRLNEVLGPGGWSFTVKEHGFEAEADELWALGRLEATVDGLPLVREQFGSQKHNRRRADGQILDAGFDLKGAATDALKKCATLIGVGLYMSEKEGGIPQGDETPKAAGSAARTTAKPAPPVSVNGAYRCVECLQPIVAQGGLAINANQASIIKERFGALVCRDHRKAEVRA